MINIDVVLLYPDEVLINPRDNLCILLILMVICVTDVFLPCPDGLLVNLHESKSLISDLLSQLPEMFEKNRETGNAMGAALQVSLKLMVSVVNNYNAKLGNIVFDKKFRSKYISCHEKDSINIRENQYLLKCISI